MWLNLSMVVHLNDLVTREQIGRITEDELRLQGYIRIRRGVYLPQELLPLDAPRWKIRRVISEARALSVSVVRKESPPPVLTLESALVICGLNTWVNTADVSYRIEENLGRRGTRDLPAISIGTVDICAVKERQLLSFASRGDTVGVNGVLVAPLEVVALDCARFLHPLPGVVAVSSVLSHLSRFDRRNQSQSRVGEAQVKEAIRRELTQVSGRKGCQQASAILDVADAGIQTPGEGYLWWLLHCMLPEHERCQLITQFHVNAEGRNYYPDAALPHRKIYFEFDGFGKIPENERDFLTRQRALASAGWTPIRIDQRQLGNPRTLIEYLMRELRGCGISVHYPQGISWKPIPYALLAPARRY